MIRKLPSQISVSHLFPADPSQAITGGSMLHTGLVDTSVSSGSRADTPEYLPRGRGEEKEGRAAPAADSTELLRSLRAKQS